MNKKKEKFNIMVNEPTNKKFPNGVKRNQTHIAKTMKSEPSQKEIKNALKDAPKGSTSWGMKINGNKFSKVGRKEKK